MELGITSPLTQTGGCKFVKGWLVDTATIYRIGITRTGTAVVALAIGNIVIGGTMMALNKKDPWAGLGLWTGFIMTIAGMMCLIMRRKRPRNIVSILSGLCLAGFITSLVSMATSTYNIWAIYDDPNKRYPNYILALPECATSLYVMNGLLLTLSVFQVLFSFWSLCLSMGHVWSCLRVSGSSIFTIMVEDDPLASDLARHQDTELSEFSMNNNRNVGARQSTLQIQTDWLEQTPCRDTELGR